MMKNKAFRSFAMLAAAAVSLVSTVVQSQAWDTINIDHETHRDNPSLAQGTYTDWTNLPYPWRNSQWPYVMNNWSRYTSTWDVGQSRTGVAVWRIQIPRTGWYGLKTTYKRTHNRTSEANYQVFVNATLADIENRKLKPVYQEFVDQYGEADLQYHWADFGAFCLDKGDVSVLVLDARETYRSSSADSAQWTFLGDTYNSVPCPKSNLAPVNSLLLTRDKREK